MSTILSCKYIVNRKSEFVAKTHFLCGFGDLIRLNIETNSPLKPTKVGFIFIGPNSLGRVEDLGAVNHVTQAVVRVGLNTGLRNYGSSRSFLITGSGHTA